MDVFLFKGACKKRNAIEKVGPMCYVHRDRIIRTDKRTRNVKKLKSKERAKTCWVNPMEIARHDDGNTELNIVSKDRENLCIRYHDSRIAAQKRVTCTRCSPDSPWTLANNMVVDIHLPVSIRTVPEDYVP